MSCCGESSGGGERITGTGCCGSNCASEREGCPASEPRIRSCMCQENVGCLDRADCGGFRPRGTAATGACPGPCQCAEEDAWNRNIPPKPNCEWLSNFSELRRQWSDHARKNNCKCCSCAPTKKAAPCRPCLPSVQCCGSSMKIQSPRCDDRLAGGACGSSNGCGSSQNHHKNSQQSSNSCQPCSPSPKPILKNRSCCQCVSGGCMCQPMSRTCKCPPPVQVDVRADKECSCECPSSPECACPPSERRFSRSRTKCPNAKLCHTPRLQPGPKCDCIKCQPCLPPPCDPCTASKCRPATPKIPPCIQEDPYESSSSQNSCRSCPPCSSCKKTQSQKPRCEISDSSRFYTPCRGSGQSEHCFRDSESRHDEGEVMAQCRCGSDAKKLDDNCQHCCSIDCASGSDDSSHEIIEKSSESLKQCSCGPGGNGRDDDFNFCCSVDYGNNRSEKCCKAQPVGQSNHQNFQSKKLNVLKMEKHKSGVITGGYRRSSRLLESLKRARNILPSTSSKPTGHRSSNCCDG